MVKNTGAEQACVQAAKGARSHPHCCTPQLQGGWELFLVHYPKFRATSHTSHTYVCRPRDIKARVGIKDG